MKVFPCLLALLALVPLSARAQVSVEVRMGQTQFLRNESLLVSVRVSNRTGLPLQIGETADWLTFSVVDRDGRVISPVANLNVGGNFELASASSVTKTIDISPAYDFNTPGKFRLTATAQFPKQQLIVNSDPQPFEIVRGAVLWQDVCGVASTNSAAPPQLIRYSLLQASHLSQPKLYVRVSDEAEELFARVLPLGGIVSFGRPEQIIDRSSRLHVLYQSTPRVFEYCQVSPTGEVSNQRVYDMTAGNPRLKIREDGAVEVIGGRLRGAPVVASGAAARTNATTVPKPQN